MTSTFIKNWRGMLLLYGFMPLVTMSATIWNGPLISYSQPAPYPDPPNDRDQLTPNVALTRANPSGGTGNGGIFNAVTETSFTKGVSPADTEWAVGSLSNYATLSYSDWTSAGGGQPVRNLPGKQLVVHLISDDIYLSIEFTSLPSGPGFSYTRSTPSAANNPPSLAITNPPSGTVFAAPADVAIQAAVTNGSGTVTNVQFLVGATVLTNETVAPFAAAAPFAAGTYSLSAIATDNNGLSATDSVSISVVNPVPVNLASPMRLSPSNFQFNYSANVGLQYVVRRSTNLLATNWLAVATNTAAASSMSFTDTTATASPQFYRVARLPNP